MATTTATCIFYQFAIGQELDIVLATSSLRRSKAFPSVAFYYLHDGMCDATDAMHDEILATCPNDRDISSCGRLQPITADLITSMSRSP